MVLDVIKYGHPTLRQKGSIVPEITPEILHFIQDMLDTMYAQRGVGLAAQQVNRAVQICVIDIRGAERPSALSFSGLRVDPEKFMPMVLINPRVTLRGEDVAGQEGCLSFPEMYGDVIRKQAADVEALKPDGSRIHFSCSGFLARAIQHEVDHLNGELFIDRMVLKDREALRKRVRALQKATRQELGLED